MEFMDVNSGKQHKTSKTHGWILNNWSVSSGNQTWLTGKSTISPFIGDSSLPRIGWRVAPFKIQLHHGFLDVIWHHLVFVCIFVDILPCQHEEQLWLWYDLAKQMVCWANLLWSFAPMDPFTLSEVLHPRNHTPVILSTSIQNIRLDRMHKFEMRWASEHAHVVTRW